MSWEDSGDDNDETGKEAEGNGNEETDDNEDDKGFLILSIFFILQLPELDKDSGKEVLTGSFGRLAFESIGLIAKLKMIKQIKLIL